MTMTEREKVIDECIAALHKEAEQLEAWVGYANSGMGMAIETLEDLRATPAAAPVSPAAPNRSGATAGATEANAHPSLTVAQHHPVTPTAAPEPPRWTYPRQTIDAIADLIEHHGFIGVRPQWVAKHLRAYALTLPEKE